MPKGKGRFPSGIIRQLNTLFAREHNKAHGDVKVTTSGQMSQNNLQMSSDELSRESEHGYHRMKLNVGHLVSLQGWQPG